MFLSHDSDETLPISGSVLIVLGINHFGRAFELAGFFYIFFHVDGNVMAMSRRCHGDNVDKSISMELIAY